MRARRWLGVVSREIYPTGQFSEEHEKQRAKWFIDRVGVDVSGPVRAAGIELTLVDRDNGALAQTVPSILEGSPIAYLVPAFESAAIASAVSGHSAAWNGLRWLCLFNQIDPEAAAEALRALAFDVKQRAVEAGVNPALPAQAAALLLEMTGEETDETAAAEFDTGQDELSYQTDYLPHPGRSFFELERRHADQVMRDMSMPLLARAERISELWLDPAFEPSAEFTAELRAQAASFNVIMLDRRSGPTLEDHNFELLEPALARSAPDLLADLMTAKLRQSSGPPADARYWRAIRATEQLILTGQPESDAARSLRISAREMDPGSELHAATQLLILELHAQGAYKQFETVLGADLEHILLSLTAIFKPLTQGEAENLLEQFETGPPQQKRNLIVLLWGSAVASSPRLWDWLMTIAEKDTDVDIQGLAFRSLAKSDEGRFGRHLLARGWSWSPQGNYWANHYGSGALIKAAVGVPFDQLASRLAPWRLLEATRERGGDPTEVQFAASIFGSVLLADQIDTPDLGAIVIVDRTVKNAGPDLFSVIPSAQTNDPADPISNLQREMDTEAQVRGRRRAIETAVRRIREARATGASLYLANVDPDDIEQVLHHAPGQLEIWIQGATECTSDFRRRALLAEPAYLAICEGLLRYDQVRGAHLWRSLNQVLTTRFIGEAKVDEMIHMVFRAPESPPVAALRASLLGVERTSSDKDLLALAVAACLNGKSDWLSQTIAEDKDSTFAWRRRRGEVLEGFISGNTLPQPEAWPDHRIRTHHEHLRKRSARFRYLEACAHHWWRAYLSAPDPATAYASWVLFLRAVDRRAWIWMSREVREHKAADSFSKLKLSQVEVNIAQLERQMENQERRLGEEFLGRPTCVDVWPWRKSVE
jgi:hypothetical protein